MKIKDAPLHQERWRTLVDGPIGSRSYGRHGQEMAMEYVSFGARGGRRFEIVLSPEEATALRDWLNEVLSDAPPLGNPHTEFLPLG